MRVQVVVAGSDVQDLYEVELEEGASIEQALAAAHVRERHPGLALDRVGVWGKRRPLTSGLRDGDRVEVYRPLRADAKAIRRTRAGLRPSTRSRTGP